MIKGSWRESRVSQPPSQTGPQAASRNCLQKMYFDCSFAFLESLGGGYSVGHLITQVHFPPTLC